MWTAGIQINWDQIKGLKENIGKAGVCSNYAYQYVDSTWETLRNFQGGNAIFTPPMSSPEFIARSPLADANGWVEAHKETLQHLRFPNVFALGDCSSLPTSKTGAAIRKQAPVVVRNLRAAMAGKPLTATYDGYTSCPVVTGYGRLILAEFDYNQQPAETFPVDQSKERWSMWLLKKYLLPVLYWQGMLKGRA